MKNKKFSTSACRYCRFYEPEGRRGGSCQILGVPVQSSWKACSIASPPFENTLKKLEDIFQLETSISLDSPERIIPQVSQSNLNKEVPQMATPKIE